MGPNHIDARLGHQIHYGVLAPFGVPHSGGTPNPWGMGYGPHSLGSLGMGYPSSPSTSYASTGAAGNRVYNSPRWLMPSEAIVYHASEFTASDPLGARIG